MATTRFSFVISLLGVCAVALAGPHGRILEGEDAASGQFPHQVSVRLDSVHVASGSIIDQWHIITAAHPFSDSGVTPVNTDRVDIRVGSTNQYASGLLVQIDKIIIHPSYGNFLHDIAVIKLRSALSWTDKIKAIELAKADDELEGETKVTIAGWGLLGGDNNEAPYKLQHASQLSVLSAPECEYRAGYGYASVLCLDHNVGEGICRGDEGAGVVANNKLYGVASFAFGNCGSQYPDVSSKVSYYSDWIAAQTA